MHKNKNNKKAKVNKNSLKFQAILPRTWKPYAASAVVVCATRAVNDVWLIAILKGEREKKKKKNYHALWVLDAITSGIGCIRVSFSLSLPLVFLLSLSLSLSFSYTLFLSLSLSLSLFFSLSFFLSLSRSRSLSLSVSLRLSLSLSLSISLSNFLAYCRATCVSKLWL
jgi:hypothetical protein